MEHTVRMVQGFEYAISKAYGHCPRGFDGRYGVMVRHPKAYNVAWITMKRDTCEAQSHMSVSYNIIGSIDTA